MAAKKKTTVEAIPLRDMTNAIDTNDFGFYSRLTKDQQKAFSAWMAMRYASSATGTAAYHYLLMINDIVNVEFNTLKHHPELQWKLLAVCGIGSPTYHPWIAPGKKRKKNKVEQFLAGLYPLLSHNEIKMLAKLNTREDIYELAKDTGMSDKDIEKMLGDE
jgi:hypothetical protein